MEGYQVANTDSSTRCRAWHSPPEGYVKINTDVAFFAEETSTGIGLVLRDSSGSFIQARTKLVPGCVDVDVGEAWGFMEAISWAKSMGLENVVIEGDAKRATDAIHRGATSNSVFGDYIRECKHLLVDSHSFSIVHVNREANGLAHEFARTSILYGSSHCWTDPPEFVAGLPNTLCLCNNMS